MPANDIDKLISDAAAKQIEKLKLNLEGVVSTIADINKAGAAMEAQLAKNNLGWAKTIGITKKLAENSNELDEAMRKLVTANDALQAAEAKHHSRLAKLAESLRTQALLNNQVAITNTKVKDSTLKVVDAINLKQKADLKAQVTATEGSKVNTRAALAEKAHTVELQKEIVTIEALMAENKKLIAQRNLIDISTHEGRMAVKDLNVGIAENTKLINKNIAANAASATSVAAVGKGMTKMLGYLRNLAYILPGIGIAGIFNLLIEGVTRLVEGYGKATGAQGLLNEAMKDGAKASAVETWNLDRLYKKSQDTTISIEERKEAVDKLQKLFPAYFKNISDEIILNGGAADSYKTLRESIIAMSKAKAIESAIVKVYNDDMEHELALIKKVDDAKKDQFANKDSKNIYSGPYGGSFSNAETKEKANEYRKIQRNNAEAELVEFRALQQKKIKILLDALDKQEQLIDDRTLPDKTPKAARTPRGAADLTDDSPTALLNAKRAEFMANYQLMKEDAEKQAEINKKIVDNDEKMSKDRHGLLEEYAAYKKRMLFTDEKIAVREIVMSDKIKTELENDLFDRQDALAAYYANKQNLLDLEETKELKELEFHNIAIQNKMTQMQTKLDRGKLNAYNTKVVKNELAAEQFLYDENLKTIAAIVEKYNREQLGTTEQFKAANLALIQKYDQKEIEATMERWRWIKAFNEQAAREELETIAANLEAWSKMPDDTDRFPEPTEESKYKFEKKMYYLNTYLEMEQAATTILMGLADAQYAHEMKLIDDRQRKLDETYDADKKRIESSFTSKVDQEREMLKLEARKEVLQKQIDRDRKAAARKQAKDQKASDIANIVGSTYVAVMGALGAKPWTFANIAIAAGIAATGAANLARVVSTPLPAYKDGTLDHPGGDAIVGDGGKREIVLEPGKKPWITDNMPTLVNLPKHTKVLPDAELIRPLFNAGLINMAASGKSDTNSMAASMLGAFEDKIDELIFETKNNKSNTYIDIIDLSSHNLHVQKNRR